LAGFKFLKATAYFFSSAGLTDFSGVSDLNKSLIELVVVSQAELMDAHPVKQKRTSTVAANVKGLIVFIGFLF